MDIMLIAPIDLYCDASAGSETINFYIKYLADNGHRIRTVSLSKPSVQNLVEYSYVIPRENKLEEKIRKIKKGIGWLFNPGNKYVYKTSKKLRNNIYKLLFNLKSKGYYPNVIILETVAAYLWVDDVKNIYPKAKIVAGLHDIGYQGTYNRLLIEKNYLKKIFRKRFYLHAKNNELVALSKMDLILIQSATNGMILKKDYNLSRNRMVHISPFYTNNYKHCWRGGYDILFYGLMNRPENFMSALWFIDNVMPLLPDKFRFIVMGGKPVAELQAKANDRVIVTGFVTNEQVQEYFESAFCFVCPLLFGSGIKTKLLTAFAAGMPILTNNIGIEGIAAKHGQDYFHCETAEEYSRYIQQLADNEDLYKRFERKALNVVDRDYNLSHSCEKYEQALLNLINEGEKHCYLV